MESSQTSPEPIPGTGNGATPESSDATGQKDNIRSWFKRLQNDRGARAELRHANSDMERALVPMVYDLHRAFGPRAGKGYNTRLGEIAYLLAHLRESDDLPGTPFAQAAAGSGTDKQPLSPLRFRRVLQKDGEELIQALRRALPLCGAMDIAALANDLFYWGDKIRRKWAEQYYARGDK